MMSGSPVLEQRVTTLEEMMVALTRNVGELTRNVNNLQEEMREFKEEMREFKDEMRDFKSEMNKKWGELSNKMGTMAEDLVAPSIGRILKETVGCPADQVEWQAVRYKIHNRATGRQREFDVVAMCGDYLLINETKSNLKPEDLPEFANSLSEVRSFFPHYADKQIIGSIGSLYVDESLVRHGERLGLIVLGSGDHLMQVLNSAEFSPHSF